MTVASPSTDFSASQLEAALELHRSALVVDAHADTAQRLADEAWSLADLPGYGMLSLESARKGGLHAATFAAWVEPHLHAGRFADRAFDLIDAVRTEAHRHRQALRLCRTPREVQAARAEGLFAMLLSVEGGHAIENSLDTLRAFHDLGVRSLTLTWSNSTDWADSCGDLDNPAIPHHGGLTRFGREVIAEMNRLGMMVDVSHVSDATLADVLACTTAPIIASHSSARALTDTPRNLTDAQLRAIAANGGIVCVNFYAGFISAEWRATWNPLRPELEAAHAAMERERAAKGARVTYAHQHAIDAAFAARLPRPPLSALIDHIEHVARVAGPDHVGLGSDFDGIPQLPEGIDTAADLPKITAALLARGFTPGDLTKLLGANLLRVMGEAQAAARPRKSDS